MARIFSGDRLRSRRIEAGLKPERLALLADCSVYSIHSLELGRRAPSAKALGALADALGCQVDDLYAESAVANVA